MEKPKEVKKVEEPKTLPIIEQTNAASARQEKATADLKEQLDRQEKLLAEQKLGGQADARQPEPEKKEVSNVEYMKEVLAGKHNDNPAEVKKE